MKKGRKILIAILILIIIGCVSYIAYYYLSRNKNEQVYDEIQQEVMLNEPVQKEKNDGSEVEIPIDFEKLQEQNPDVYAWIKIDGTNVNYPILQSETNNSYYLDHTIDGTQGYPGSIYTENWNSREFTDYNTVIYGHEMKDGSMFHDLMNYDDPEYMEKHPQVIIYTPEKKLTYDIFAYVEYDDRHILHSYDFAFPEGRQEFLDSLYSSRSLNNVFRDDVTVSTDDRIITLSTCMPGVYEGRILVEAVLVNEEQ